MKKINIIAAIAIVAVVVFVAAVVFFMMNRDSKSSSFEVSNGNLIISGSFGITVPIAEIADLRLSDSMPVITTKTNGAWLGDACKGEFILENNIKARLYVDISAPPFITLKHSDTTYYLNAATPADTQALHEQLVTAIK